MKHPGYLDRRDKILLGFLFAIAIPVMTVGGPFVTLLMFILVPVGIVAWILWLVFRQRIVATVVPRKVDFSRLRRFRRGIRTSYATNTQQDHPDTRRDGQP